MKWLITCFEPFAQAKTNSSEIVWRQLKRSDFANQAGFVGPLPVSYARAWTTLAPKVGGYDGVLALGQAESRNVINLECLALNWIDAAIADNDGVKTQLQTVSDGPEVLWSRIPWARLGEDNKWTRSYSAGAFVCNQLMYHLLNWAGQNGKMGGFVHIPALTSQGDLQFNSAPKMPDADACAALETIVRFLISLDG